VKPAGAVIDVEAALEAGAVRAAGHQLWRL